MFKGAGVSEFGIVTSGGPLKNFTVVKVDEPFLRPAEVELLRGDPSKVC
jgi:GDP-D-mannose dehydratase